MAYIFINENSPEEQEYCSNYIYFNEKEPGALKKMMQKCLTIVEHSRKKHKGYELLKDDLDNPLQFA